MFRLLFGSFLKPNSPLYSSEYIEYLVRVTKPSVDGTLLSIISQNHSTPVPLSLVVIIFRAPPVNEIALEKKKIISIYRNRISTYFSPRSKTNVSIRCWMKRIPIPVYSINYTRCYFDSRKTLLDIHSDRLRSKNIETSIETC